MKINIKRQIFIFFIISIFWLVSFFYFKNRLKNTENSIIENFIKEQNDVFNAFYLTTNYLVTSYSEKIFLDKKTLQILKEAQKNEDIARRKLLLHLLSIYEHYKELYNGFELHFHTKDGRSFLRFYKIDMFGDDLKKVREDVTYVFEKKHAIYGFTGGRYIFGLRYTFPIFSENGEYLGSYDISLPIDIFCRNLLKVEQDLGFKIFLKRDFVPLVYKDKIPSQEYFDDLIEYEINISSLPILYEIENIKEVVKKLIEKNESFGLIYKSPRNIYKVCSIPLKTFDDEISGYIFLFKRSQELTILYATFYRNIFIFSFLYFVIYLLISVLLTQFEKVSFQSKKINSIISFMNSGLCFLDNKMRIEFINKKFSELLGYSNEELIGKEISELFYNNHKEDCPLCNRLKNKGKFEGEIVLKKKNGNEMYAFVSAADVNIKGKVIGFIISLYDITKRKMTENLLYIASITDPLTGLYNRRYIEELLQAEKEKAFIYGDIFSIVMIDLDNFKEINDKYGHNIGDIVLKKVTDTIKNCIRTTDIPGRFGGDEFIIIMKNTKKIDASTVAECLRRKIESLSFDRDIKVTASFGIAEYDFSTGEDVINKADQKLYMAKKMGKNCVCYEDISV